MLTLRHHHPLVVVWQIRLGLLYGAGFNTIFGVLQFNAGQSDGSYIES